MTVTCKKKIYCSALLLYRSDILKAELLEAQWLACTTWLNGLVACDIKPKSDTAQLQELLWWEDN